jgi:hypothetical protein
MESTQEQLKNISDIRNIMERSSRFLSLSGLSGISAGFIALIGATFAFFILGYNQRPVDWENYYNYYYHNNLNRILLMLYTDGFLTLVLALASGIYFTARRVRIKGLPIWDHTIKKFLFNLFFPLLIGGIFCIIITLKGLIFLAAPATLIFYGLALFNASKFTLDEIKYLGIIQTILGIIGCIWVGYGLILWAVGFGFAHLIYGILMYFKYEK